MSDEADDPKPQAFFHRAQAEAELEASGRFASSQRPRINGSDPTVTPPGELAPWQTWPEPGDEDRFGEEIDAVPADINVVGPSR